MTPANVEGARLDYTVVQMELYVKSLTNDERNALAAQPWFSQWCVAHDTEVFS